MFRIGSERVGSETPVAGTGTTELFEPKSAVASPTVVFVDGCSFQIQTPVAAQDVVATTVYEVAHCFMPVTDNTRAIESTMLLRSPAGLDYLMRGDAVVEVDIRGRESHVFARCERQK